MKRYLGVLSAALLVVGVMATNAFAAAGDPPTFDVTTLTPSINTLGVLVLAGVVAVFGVVLVIKGPFLLLNIARKAINKLFGRATPTAA